MRFTPVELTRPAATSAARSGLFSMISIGLQGGTRFASNWLIGRLADKVVLGAVATATSLAFTLNTLWPSSAQSAASKFIARARGKGDDAEVLAATRHTAVRVLQVTALLAVAAPPLWWILYQGPVWEGLCISAMLVTVATSQFARGVHFGAGQVARGTRIDLVTSAIGIGATLLLLALGVQNLLLTLPLTLALGVYSLLCWPWTAHGRPEPELRREIDKFVTFGAAGSIASAGMLQISQLTARGVSEHAAGIYAPALQLVTPLSIIAAALTLVLYPAMAEAHGAGDPDRLRRQTDLATRGFLAVMVPIFGALAIASRPVIDLVWGARYAEAAPLMPAFCIALLLQNVASPAVGSITSGPHKNMWYSMLLSWAGFGTAIACWAILVPTVGILGVAWGYAAGSAVTALSLLVVAWRLNGQRWWDLLARLLLAVAAIAAISGWRQSQPANPLLDVGVAAAFAVLAVLTSLRMLRRLWDARR